MLEHRIADACEISRMLTRISTQIIERNKGIGNLVLVGIVRRGDVLARRLATELEGLEEGKVQVGAIDITLYRDDLKLAAEMPMVQASSIPFDIDGKIVILVDDVLYTGRTVRAALTEILDFGRPEMIQLAVLVDRIHRELPIGADFVGKKVPAAKDEIVDVYLEECDGREGIFIKKREEKGDEK
ncbi:bifunctional pyr operon transcriptional regulator/uracil phosphoribosyltransferase PyrR [candidate division WOR-3 bacterium]|uniref:Bifunctional protein PyrR n=1 Tax=candidate division WOR-3 bacterium TaxID=2052148 RepID=A0A9D5K7R0_UNCW3|nr:bifunctional pyr operon transcriptional regulator/uracil phosphoribosyltransferase PyrR [candidate division WOR-3 bacterium]MBD3363812.1 bifunctional pyr operon transcriptional regulator/uracil phosphoribosyltransferase PyrR [candidate division WOR-3 bacterium]